MRSETGLQGPSSQEEHGDVSPVTPRGNLPDRVMAASATTRTADRFKSGGALGPVAARGRHADAAPPVPSSPSPRSRCARSRTPAPTTPHHVALGRSRALLAAARAAARRVGQGARDRGALARRRRALARRRAVARRRATVHQELRPPDPPLWRRGARVARVARGFRFARAGPVGMGGRRGDGGHISAWRRRSISTCRGSFSACRGARSSCGMCADVPRARAASQRAAGVPC